MNLELSEIILRIILICITLIYFVIQIIFNRRFQPEETVASVPLRSEIIFILLNILWPGTIILLLFSGFAYFELADIETLQPVAAWEELSGVIACVAAFLGSVRLIDNMILFANFAR